MSNEYPRMLYHPIEGQEIVQDETECENYLKKGWSKSVVPPDEKNILTARITEYETDLRQMKENLAALNGEEYEGDGLDDKIDAVIAENKKFQATIIELGEEISLLKQENETLKAGASLPRVINALADIKEPTEKKSLATRKVLKPAKKRNKKPAVKKIVSAKE